MTDSLPPARRPGPRPRPAPAPPPRTRRDRRRAERRAGRRRIVQVAAAIAVLLAAAVVFVVVQPGSARHKAASASPAAAGASLADPDLDSGFLAGAASDIAAVTTYDYRSLDDALNTGSRVTTGAYRVAYRAALTGDLAATATAHHVVQTFEVLELGIGDVSAAGGQAQVLVFGRQRVTDDTTPAGTTSPVTLRATVVHTGSRYLISDLVEGGNAGLPPGGPQLPVAAEAARAEILNLLGLRRSQFAGDLQRALGGAVSPLRDQLQRDAAKVRSAMGKGHYDLSGTVNAVAVDRASDTSVELLVAADSTRTTDGAAAPAVSHERYVVTVIRSPGGWAVSQARSVDGDIGTGS